MHQIKTLPGRHFLLRESLATGSDLGLRLLTPAYSCNEQQAAKLTARAYWLTNLHFVAFITFDVVVAIWIIRDTFDGRSLHKCVQHGMENFVCGTLGRVYLSSTSGGNQTSRIE